MGPQGSLSGGFLKVPEEKLVIPGECVLTTNMASWNEEEEEEVGGSLVVFVIAAVLLVLGLVAVAFIVKHSRSKSAPSEVRPGGYQKLGSGTAGAQGGLRFQEAQLVADSIEEDDEEDEDIVYMGRDGTVYRKFRYGQLDGEDEDELEYDDESYAFR